MMRRRILSEDEFVRASARARMEPATLAMARAVLVNARRQVDVARESGMSRAWVSEAVAKFMKCVAEAERLSIPEGWKTDTVSLPHDLWVEVRKLEREARMRLKNTSVPRLK